MSAHGGSAPVLTLEPFEGPLDLLCHLIEKNKIDIYDIPIDRITDQYLEYLEKMQAIDMEVTSEFLLMAATLLHIKSRMLLPNKRALLAEEGDDPREDLVLKLLAYRRCKTIASDLKDRYELYSGCISKPPESPSSLGIDTVTGNTPVHRDLFFAAIRHLAKQNEIRFADISGRVSHILKREKVSLRDKMLQILQRAIDKTRVFFHEIFPAGRSSRTEQVTGFLAVLELLKQNRIIVKQDRPFDAMMIEPDPQWKDEEAIVSLEDPEDLDEIESEEGEADHEQ
ncbi:MAG: segregation/condensation protein A [Eubacteriales bacterium]|nr:segregation/condensation protein A [Eubacteriales bacterium]MDD3197196.1 segregation/condensation protein A [Eubacteriales bacterium]MDD4681695.1 segregation/condensation protein A [Eubacteriales bacterium]